MPVKKIIFGIMCAVLAILIILSGFVISKVGGMVQLLLNPKLPAATISSEPTGSGGVSEPTGSETVFHDPDHVHDFVKFKTHYASCTEGGYVIYRCECGETEIRDMIDAYGHDYDAGTKVFSCTEGSYTLYVCRRCQHENKRDVVAPTGHKFTIKEDHTATCTENAYIVRRCSNPGCTVSETEITPNSAKGHSFGQWEDAGSNKKLSCTNCDCVIMASQLKITKEYISEEGNHYTVYVGTGDGATDIHRLYAYDIADSRSEEEREEYPLTYRFDLIDGLVVEYGTQSQPLGYQDKSVSIAPTAGYVPPTEPPTDAADPSEPSGSAPAA